MNNFTNSPAVFESAALARDLIFQPLLGHPGGSMARPASLPAGFKVNVAALPDGRLLLLASVDGQDDYGVYATAGDVRPVESSPSGAGVDVSLTLAPGAAPAAAAPESVPAGHLPWCVPAACILDPQNSSWIHRKTYAQSIGAADVQAAVCQSPGEPPALFLDVCGEDGLSAGHLGELVAYLGSLQGALVTAAAGVNA